jgi:hypothetical protein
MPEYNIGRLNGQFVLAFWQDGKRRRFRLGTSDPREAERLAPAVFKELTRPKGQAVSDLWSCYMADMKGRAIAGTMTHTWKALEPRFGSLSPDEIERDHCRAHIAARRAAGIQDGTIIPSLVICAWSCGGPGRAS